MAKYIRYFFSSLRLIPHIIMLSCCDKDGLIKSDITRWVAICYQTKAPFGYHGMFIKLMTAYPEYRNLFYYRIGSMSGLVRWLCWPVSTLFITSKHIGPGLFIQHGFATIIVAESIGSDCWINQQVTIGYSARTDSPPKIGNNVTINAGAKIIGNVSIGDNVKVGANAVVVKDVPANVTVVGVPAYIVRRDGVRVNEVL